MKIKAVIFHHNQPENADKLYEQLSTCFDTELWDSGSPSHRIPCHLTHPFPNFFGTGAWNYMMANYQDYDAVWLVCADVTLRNDPREYLQAITSALPFGIWSPCIEGRAHPFMLAENYQKQPYTVRNVESQAMALSGPLMKETKRLIDGSPYGFGHDFWLCYKSRQAGMRNIIDGRVCVYHPPGTGYNEQKAHEAMDQAFGSLYGPNYRQTIFQYSSFFQENLHGQYQPQENRSMSTIFTIDNGWGLQEFSEIIANFPDCKKVLMKKGVSPLLTVPGVEVIPYNPDLSGFADGNHLGLFARLGPANFEDYKKILALGIPCVVNVNYHRETIVHEKTGFVYGNPGWATNWLRALIADENLRANIKTNLQKPSAPLVTVITPTCKRDPKIISRCINCLQLQTVTDWVMLLCSDGGPEKHVLDLLKQLNEPRVIYTHLPKSNKPGDYGNTIRNEMLKRATGKYVFFCDDDNIILPEFLAKMTSAVQSADLAVCKIVHFGPLNESVTGKPPKVLTGFPIKLYHVDPLQVLVKRECMQDIGWDCDHGYVSDGVTLERLGTKYKSIEVPEILGFHM